MNIKRFKSYSWQQTETNDIGNGKTQLITSRILWERFGLNSIKVGKVIITTAEPSSILFLHLS